MGLPVRQVGGLARHAEPWRGLAWRHRSPRGLSAPAGKRTPVSVLNCWRGAQAGPPRPGPASPTRMWPTRGERAQTPSSRPPCAPSLEAQRLPPKSPLPRWTVPDLGDAVGGGWRGHSPKESVLLQTETVPPTASTAVTQHRDRTRGPHIPAPPGVVCPGPEVSQAWAPKGLSPAGAPAWQGQPFDLRLGWGARGQGGPP